MNRATAYRVVDALHGLTRANWYDFHTNAQLCADYLAALKAGRFRYTADRVTCGEPDCWSLMRDLMKRYPAPKLVLGDCEDFSCAYAAWLASQCYKGIYIGLVPGKHVAHAIVGIERVKGSVRVVDPSRWYGMKPTHYNGVIWRKISAE